MNWERDAEIRQADAEREPSAFSTHYLMLKPDGNRPHVRSHVEQVLRQNKVPTLLAFQVLFSTEEALRFYPKPPTWKEKYGQKRIEAIVASGKWKSGEHPPALQVGESILMNMAHYLSERPCYVYVFQMFGAERFVKQLVGDTDPATAHKQSLRGLFSTDSLQAAGLEERALRNVAHAPDADGVADELAFLYTLKGLHPDIKHLMRAVLRPIFPHKQHLFVS